MRLRSREISRANWGNSYCLFSGGSFLGRSLFGSCGSLGLSGSGGKLSLLLGYGLGLSLVLSLLGLKASLGIGLLLVEE